MTSAGCMKRGVAIVDIAGDIEPGILFFLGIFPLKFGMGIVQ